MAHTVRVLGDTVHVLHSSPSLERPIAIDLFSGVGGLSLGFEQAGFDVVAAVEYDPVHAAAHLFNFPSAEMLCRNVANVSGADILRAAESGFARIRPGVRFPKQVDAVIGGPPCQGFSTGGKRESGDHRNELLLEFVRIVEEIRPMTLCLENVGGLLEPGFESIRTVAFERLRDAGYALSGTTTTVNSFDFGVPQTRRRVLVLGALDTNPPTRPQILETSRVTVSDALSSLPPVEEYAELLHSDEAQLRQADIRRRLLSTSRYARILSGVERAEDDFSAPRMWDGSRHTGGRRTVHTPETLRRFGDTAPGAVEPRSRLYRLPLDGPSRTLRAGTGSERGAHTSPRPIHPVSDRVVTVREAARLHGYPDWFRFHTTNWHGHRQIGNSVPPPLAKAAGKVLLDALDSSPSMPDWSVTLGSSALLKLSRGQAQPVMGALVSEMPATRKRIL